MQFSLNLSLISHLQCFVSGKIKALTWESQLPSTTPLNLIITIISITTLCPLTLEEKGCILLCEKMSFLSVCAWYPETSHILLSITSLFLCIQLCPLLLSHRFTNVLNLLHFKLSIYPQLFKGTTFIFSLACIKILKKQCTREIILVKWKKHIFCSQKERLGKKRC